MKLLTVFVLLASFCTTAFARPPHEVCVRNDGLYVAHLTAEIWDNTSKRFFYESTSGLAIGMNWCSNSFDGSKGDYANVTIFHFTGLEILQTCKYEKINDKRIIVANGTTYNYWCHDSNNN